MIIAVDFDGTCVTHEYPGIGRDIGAAPVLRALVAQGHHLILWTMRSGKTLADAVEWFNSNEIPLFGVNHNENQSSWTDSPKVYAQLYIDDAAFGAPLIQGLERRVASRTAELAEFLRERPYINWKIVREALLK